MSPKLSSKTLTGTLHLTNKGACDWGWQGFLAYGCQNVVSVIDPISVQVVQSLDKHKGYVVKVKWAKENYHHDLASPYSLRLATADYNGKIIVWNVTQAAVIAEFSDGSKPVADMEWLRTQDASQDLLAVLHPPYSLVLWNAVTGTKIWKKSYTEVLQNFTFDPFDTSKLAFLGQDCILFVDDFSISRTPSSNGRKYYISSPNSQGGMNNSASSEKIAEKKPKSTIKIVSSILVGDNSSKRSQADENVAVNDCLELAYHPACRHHLIMLYSRELLILDLEINQTVGIVSLDRNASSFLQVMPLRQRDVLMCIHENGSISTRVRRKVKDVQIETSQSSGDFGEEFSPLTQGLNYDLKSQSDAFRLTRHSKVYGNACCPVSENKTAIVLSDGRVLFWELTAVDFQEKFSPITNVPQSPLYTPGPNLPSDLDNKLMTSSISALNLTSNTTPPKTSISDLLTHMTQSMVAAEEVDHNATVKHSVSLKFVLKGLLQGVAAPPFIVKMCPALTTKNWATYQPLLAVGTSSGNIQIFNMSGGFMVREFSIHTCAVKGIEWCSLVSFMSFSCTSPNSNGLVKNEIVLTDIQTGRTTVVRPFKDEESPLELLKVSHLKQYFVVVFRDQPFELWELKSGTRLRQMPAHFPKVTTLEWAPYTPSKSGKKKSPGDTSSMSGSTMDLTASTPSSETPSRPVVKSPTESSGPVREQFVFTDTEGLLYHFIIDGNIVKEGTKIPPDGSLSQITCLAWKGDTIVMGDVDGNLNIWDIKARISMTVPTHKGWIKRMKFAPGRLNMKLLVLHNDGTEIWDAKSAEMVSGLKFPKDMAKATDADWVGSDKPVFACLDGCLKVLDLSLQIGCAPISDLQLQDAVFSPYLLPPRASQALKNLLQHQPWNESYSLSMEETDQNLDICGLVNEQLQLIESDIQKFFLECSFGTAQRCLTTAKLFGDESDLHFWKVALHYLRQEKADPHRKKMSKSGSSRGDLFVPSTPARETSDLVDLSDSDQREEKVWAFVKDRPLENSYDVLCDNATFQKNQLDRISLHDQKRTSYEHTRKCAENLMMLGQTDRAVQLLLETEASRDGYYTDCLRACLVASVRSSGASQSTIKLVATNLIANGKLSEGVQLLCLIDKGMDACRYLQTYGEWHQAAWLAKATLDYQESCEVMKRWADHLNTPQVNQKTLAVLVLLSLSKFVEVIEMLYGMRQFDRAALFIEACLEFQLLPDNKETTTLVEAVFLEYARYQLNISNRKAAEYYCKRAGEKGKLLLQEIVAAFSP